MTDPVREFIRAFNERDLDAFVAVDSSKVKVTVRSVRVRAGWYAANIQARSRLIGPPIDPPGSIRV